MARIWILFYLRVAKQYFTNERSEWVKYCFCHKKIKFISSSCCVLLYRQKDIGKIIDFHSPKSNCEGSNLQYNNIRHYLFQRRSDFSPEDCIGPLSKLAAERLKDSCFFWYLLIKNPFKRPREIKISQFSNCQNASQDLHVPARNHPADHFFLIGCH